MFEVSLKFTENTKRELERLPRNFRRGLEKGMKMAMLYAEGEAKKRFGKPGGPKVGTGRLRQSIKSRVETRFGDVVTGSIGSNLVYATTIEYGNVIKPRRGEYLTFKVGGQWVKLKQAIIPEYPFLRPAIENNLRRFGDIIGREIEKEVNK
jgi:phage gpG-like protein